MAWRPAEYLIEGELDNTHPGRVTGWMRFAGIRTNVTFDLEGDFHRDIRGAKIHFAGNGSELDPPEDAARFMKGFARHQRGRVGDITAGLPPVDYVTYPYLEWYGEENGRVVIELEPVQVEVIGTPIPACKSRPISRAQQERNMAEFLGSLAAGSNLPPERAVCIGGGTVITAAGMAAGNKARGLKLLPYAVRENLPILGSQQSMGGKARALAKCFLPDGPLTWYITEGSARRDRDGKAVDYLLFGLVDGQSRELSYFWLSDLATLRGPKGLRVERDANWRPKTLEEIAPEMFQPEKKQVED